VSMPTHPPRGSGTHLAPWQPCILNTPCACALSSSALLLCYAMRYFLSLLDCLRAYCRAPHRRLPTVVLTLMHFCLVCQSMQGLLQCEELENVPFLILGNKIDLGRAASEDVLRIQLGVQQTTTGKGKVRSVVCVVLCGQLTEV